METIQFHINRLTRTFNQKHDENVRKHLSQVYMVLAGTSVATAVGTFSQMSGVLDFGALAAVSSLLLVLGLHLYKDDGKNYTTRLAMLLAFGFFSGQTIGPLLSYAVSVNSNILLTALGGTAITFGSLSMAALFADRGKYLFLGGILALIINTMLIVSLMNVFFQVYMIQMAQLYIGVLVMAAFVLFDTQSIIEKCMAGNRDVVQHAMDLFFDVISMFRRLVIILTQKEERKREERHKRH